MGIRRPSTYSYPPKFNKLEDAENYSKRLYAELLENDSRGEEITARATDKDLKELIVRPEWFGTTKDDYGSRVNSAIDYAETNNLVVVISGPESFATTIELGTAVVHFNNHVLTYTGSGTAIKNKTNIRPGWFYGLKLDTTANWTNVNLIGLCLTGAYKCRGEITEINNFTTGFKLNSISTTYPSAYNNFTFGGFSVNKIGLHLDQSGADGWTNENKFYGGNFSPGSSAPAGSVGIKLSSTSANGWSPDHNVFFSPSLEAHETGIQFIHAWGNHVFSPRFEGNTVDVSYDVASVLNLVAYPNMVPVIVDNSVTTYGVNYEVGTNLCFGRKVLPITISSGVISIGLSNNSFGYVNLINEGFPGVVVDDLDTINGGRDGDEIIVSSYSTSILITVKNGTGNILLSGNEDVVLEAGRQLVLFYNGSDWLEIGGWNSKSTASLIFSGLTKGYLPYDAAEDLVVNGGFDSDTSSWAAVDCNLASVAGGQSGNCLEMTYVSGTYQYAHQNITTVFGKTYTFSCWVKSGTSGAEAFQLSIGDTNTIDGTTSGTWTKYSRTVTASGTSYSVKMFKVGSTPGTMLFDTVSVQGEAVLADSPLSTDGTDIDNSGVYKVDGTQVVGAQGAAIADATNGTDVITRLNDLLAICRTHGIIDT
jgi:hypothetical protein